MISLNELGKGLIPHSEEDTGVLFAAPIPVPPFNWDNIPIKNTLFPGTNQGSSMTCQTQAVKMVFKRKTGFDISVEDIYSQIYLPGGGAYLIAPAQFINSQGYISELKYPEPNPETEEAMETAVIVKMGDRLRFWSVDAIISPVDTIDAVAQAILAHDAAIIGIWWTNAGFSHSLTEPTYQAGDASQEGHALLTVQPVMYNGMAAIDCETSWYGVEGPDGICTHHIIDHAFFANGGVFELLTLDFKEITMNLVKDNGTVYLVASDKSFKWGIGDPGALELFGDESISEDSTAGIPQTYTLATGIIAHK